MSRIRFKKPVFATIAWILPGATMALLFAVAGNTTWAQSPDWAVETVADGSQCSLAYAPDNNSSIAYTQDSIVMLTHWNGSSWDSEEVAAGVCPDVAYDPFTGQAMICCRYSTKNRTYLRFARKTESSWWVEQIDTLAGNFPQVACDPNTGWPAIAYVTVADRIYVLKMARWNGSSWDLEIVESNTRSLGFGNPSLEYDKAGNPAIAFKKQGFGELRLARWNPATASWNTEVVDSPMGGAYRASLAFNPVSGYPAIAYVRETPSYGGEARIAQWNGSRWDIDLYYPGEWSGWYSSLAFDQSGSPQISLDVWYPENDFEDLLVTRWTGSAWMPESVIGGPTSTASFQAFTHLMFHPVSGIPTVATCVIEGGVTRVIFAQRTSLIYQYPPLVSILLPENGAGFSSGATIDFLGSATDVEDGDLGGVLVWTSDKDGQIGTGASVFATLSDGAHTITATATDSGGKTGSDSVTITVGAPPTVSVSSIAYSTEGGKNSDKHLNVTVALENESGDPVAGASVSIDLFRDGSLAASWTDGITAADGTVTFQLENARPGTYTTTVTDVQAAGYVWDGVTPPNSFTK